MAGRTAAAMSAGRAWWWVAALVLAVVQVPVLVKTGADASQSDFANYYTPAWVLSHAGDVGALYDRDSFASAMRESGLEGLGSFIPHPPANALWLLPVSRLPVSLAKGLWSAALVGALLATMVALSRLAGGGGLWWAAAIALAPTLAIRNSLAFGQPYVVLAALLAVGALALERQRDFAAGVLLGLGVSFKPYALAIGLLFVGRGRGRVLGGFVVGALAPSLLLAALAGAGPFIEFGTKVFPWMLRGEIQDPFSPVWGSAMSLANRMFRFESDLNPHPLLVMPLLARFAGAAASVGLLVLGVLCGRRAFDSGRTTDAVAIVVAFSLAASPFTASYHLVLLSLPVAVLVAARRDGAAVGAWLFWVILGSSAMNLFRDASGPLTALAYARLFGIVALAMALSWSFMDRKAAVLALALGAVAGIVALRYEGGEDAWPRVEGARGYASMKPHFCGPSLRFFSPSSDGRRLESRGEGTECGVSIAAAPTRGSVGVLARFANGSYDLYLVGRPGEPNLRLTRSSANEIDPAMAPDGCSVVFASDQGRGLGSTALYRLDLSPFIGGCAGPGRASGPR